MSSGAIVGHIIAVMPPATLYAGWGTIAGTSSPAEQYPVWTFPDAAAAYLDLLGYLKGYGGGGITITLGWLAAVATNSAVWQAAFRRIGDDIEDLDTTVFTYDFNNVIAPAPSVVGEVAYDNITFTNGADMDSLADGEFFGLRLKRDPAHASDNLANTAQLLDGGWIIRET